MNSNPYAPPESIDDRTPKRSFVRTRNRGPALSVAVSGLLGGFIAPYFLNYNFELAILFPAIGCIVGGVAYRYRSSAWPVDPTALRRTLTWSAALAAIPISLALLTGLRAQWYGIVAIISAVFISIAVGVLLAGPRRDGDFTEA